MEVDGEVEVIEEHNNIGVSYFTWLLSLNSLN